MANLFQNSEQSEPPAMGERRARWGYGYQDKVATARILDIIRGELRSGIVSLEGIRIADLQAGRTDDFVIVYKDEIQGNSIKWSGDSAPMNWGDLIGINGLLKELANGSLALSHRWPGRKIKVRLHTNRPPACERHHAQLIKEVSVADFLLNNWPIGPRAEDSKEIIAAWDKIGTHLGLDNAAILEFVPRCELILGAPQPPHVGPPSHDYQHYLKQFDLLHKAIATFITNYPDAEFIERNYLLSAIGFKDYRSGLVQRFPMPQIPYEKNNAYADALKDAVRSTPGGYIAVAGSAGIGKSTLVQDVLSDYPFFIPYFAYIPDGEGNPRDRGEALTFFQDVTIRLDKFYDQGYSIGIAEIAQGREALRQHMFRANKHYIAHGNKTILLIDGLDHVMREPGLERSILSELPRPEEVPAGFIIILSSQPQALLAGVIERHVAAEIAPGSARRIDMERLGRNEIYAIIGRSRRATEDHERKAIFEACQGNPLILTYLFNSCEANETLSIDQIIGRAGNYLGDIDRYYSSALAISLQNTETRTLLALLSRAAPTIPISWLQKWPEWMRLETLYVNALAPFVREEDGCLFFIHNSLISFLRQETRSRVPGVDPEQSERDFHSDLADRCGQAACVDPLGRAKVRHLLRSKRHKELILHLSSPWLREAVAAFLPFSEIRPLITQGLAASWELGHYGDVARLTLLGYELDQRASRIDPGELARRFLGIDLAPIAISQIRSMGRILVDDKVALNFVKELWVYSNKKNKIELQSISKKIYIQTKPVGLLNSGRPIDTQSRPEAFEILMLWAEVAPLFEPTEKIISQTEIIEFENWHSQPDRADNSMKARILFESLCTELQIGSGIDACEQYLYTLSKLNNNQWLFASLIKYYYKFPSENIENRLKLAYSPEKCSLNSRLNYAKLLYRINKIEQAIEIISGLGHIRYDPFSNTLNTEARNVTYTVGLRCMQDLLGVSQGQIPGVKNTSEEAFGRVEQAAHQLGAMFAEFEKTKSIENMYSKIRSIILFENNPVIYSTFDWRNNYALGLAKTDLYKTLIALATRIGETGFRALREVVLDLSNGPASAQILPHHRRMFALSLFQSDNMNETDATSFGLSSTIDLTDNDPMQRQSVSLDIANFLHEVGNTPGTKEWLFRAAKVSAGTGTHKDHHMATIAEWLIASTGPKLNERDTLLVDKFARAVEVSGGAGGSTALENLLKTYLACNPSRTTSLARELINRGIINISTAIEALLEGGAKGGASPSLLISIFTELLTTIHPGNTSNVALAIYHNVPHSEKLATAHRLMASIRINALPSHRISVARSVQSALMKDGFGEVDLENHLKAGSDDSSMKSYLYKLADGKNLNHEQVAFRLGNHNETWNWNPNPTENSGFDWWPAVCKAEILNKEHMEKLAFTFPPPDYREVELLAWKSTVLLKLGFTQEARLLAEEAVSKANTGSWFKWHDGAKLMQGFASMMAFDKKGTLTNAQKRFGDDLSSGKLLGYSLFNYLEELFHFLEIPWPGEAIKEILDDYLESVLSANIVPSSFDLCSNEIEQRSVDFELCNFISNLLSFPVLDVGHGARRALAKYATNDGAALVALFKQKEQFDLVQLEHLLACIDIGLSCQNTNLNILKQEILTLNQNESLGVRGIARRIAERNNWGWSECNNNKLLSKPIAMPFWNPSNISPKDLHMIVGGEIEIAFRIFNALLLPLLMTGANLDELRAEFNRQFNIISTTYLWQNEERLNIWIRAVLTRAWLKPRAIIGRESAMRVLGLRSLSGQAPPSLELAYDQISPIYDPIIELFMADERPFEMKALEWDVRGQIGAEWKAGVDVELWSSYPNSIGDLQIIGERTMFVRPEWECPKEERYRGLVVGLLKAEPSRECLASKKELTYESYLQGEAQQDHQIVVWNSTLILDGPVYRWMAFNSTFAKELGWLPSCERPFEWLDAEGELMVKSVHWKDGWIGIEPPRFEALGEGWLVLATPKAIGQVLSARSSVECHLWVERHSGGDTPYRGAWHLSALLTALQQPL